MMGEGEDVNSIFHEIYDQYHQDLFQFIFYMVKNREETEDLVQEVYIRVIKSAHTFENKSSKKTWLFAIAKNVTIDHFRKQRNWKERIHAMFDWDCYELKDEGRLPEEKLLVSEEVKHLYMSLDQCTTNQRLVLIMRYINDLTIAETAEALKWSESKVKTTQHRAVQKLKEIMQEQEVE